MVANGDGFTFANTGGYGGIDTSSTYYAYVSSNVLYVYASRHNAITPGASWIQPSGAGVAANVRIVVPEARPIGTAGVALHRILAAIVELDGDHAAHAQTSASMSALVTHLTGSDFVEDDIGLAKALQMLVAILAGRLAVTQDGTRFTFHRIDAGQTAVVRADASATGRAAPVIDPE